MGRHIRLSLFLLLVPVLIVAAQTRRRLEPADFGKWESLTSTELSPDGKWLVYGIARSNRNNELRVIAVGGGEPKVAAFGMQPAFSSDSKWLAYSIGYSESQEEKLRKEKKPVHRKLGLLNLTSGEQVVIEGIASFAFSENGQYMAIRRYEPERKDASTASPSADEAAPGATLVVRQLATGRDTTFGNVAEYAWQDLPREGHLLALTISAEDRTGNGIHLFDPVTGVLRVLDSGAAIYTGLAWREDSADLAVLRSETDERHEGPAHAALAWKKLGDAGETRHLYDPASDSKFAAGRRIVAYRRPSWSHDGATLFLGEAEWREKPTKPTAKNDDGAAKDEEEPAAVDVWHSKDIDVMPRQKVQANSDRRRNFLAAWHINEGRFVRLEQSDDEQVTPLKYRELGYARNWSSYRMERTIGRPAADIALVDLATGERIEILRELKFDAYVRPSPGGRYLIFLRDDHYWTVNTATRAVINITGKVPTSFVDRESDATVSQKPPFGVAGWTEGDESVILYDKFDLWQIAPDGSKARRLTDGAAEQIRYRYQRLDPDEEWISSTAPMHLNLFGLWSKKSGIGSLSLNGGKGVERLIWLDAGVTRPGKAKDADVYSFSVESFVDSPDVFVAGAGLKDARQVTKTNPFQDDFAWGRSELIEYKSDRGERLQGSLLYPANYEAGKRYPMIVYLYERLSNQLHRYRAPSERDYYNTAAFTQAGYFVLEPDIKFEPREPGRSVVGCVEPAVRKAVEMGLVDAGKVGVVGHSWGGFDASYLATHSQIFAAAVAGAAITNLVSNYGSHHFISGIAETDHIETGQQRMEVPLWEDLQAYIRNSAVYNVQNMKTPLLLETGDNDGTVFWHQSVELYNIARRAKKNVVMLVYNGEDHGLRKKPNQIDYHRRIHEWFGHYLKGEPAPSWIAKGVSYLEREEQLKKLKAPGK